MMQLPPFTQTQAYKQLGSLAQDTIKLSPQKLFDMAERFDDLSLESSGIFLDYSKNMIDKQVMNSLFLLAEERKIKQQIQKWLNGYQVNVSENRPALHGLLRAPTSSPWSSNHDYLLVVEQKQAMLKLAHKLDTGELKGCTGKPLSTIINIGIGGSVMGIKAAYHALASYNPTRDCRFIANIDPANIYHQLADCDLESSIFLISSKSFTTTETLTNYRHALAIMASKFGEAKAKQHFYAITASPEKAMVTGFDKSRVISFPEWVGGRFSLWSAVGLPILLCYGKNVWQQLLSGAHAIDCHMAESDTQENMAIIMALISLWQRSFMGINNHAILCYNHDLRYLTEHLQQLIMESNGKSVLSTGEMADFSTGELVWGGENSNGQHSYFQWLHQSNSLSSTDFIVSAQGSYGREQAHNQLIAMALGQSRSLFFGDKQKNAHANTVGARQSNTLVVERIDAQTLGALIALYEHRTVIMAMLWGINPFDQWGVEAGKKSANNLYPYLNNSSLNDSILDASTAGLLRTIHKKQLTE